MGIIAWFFKTKIGNIALAAILIVLAFITFKIWLAAHDANIRAAALNEFNQKQVEQNIKDQAEFNKRWNEIIGSQQAEIDRLNKQNSQIDTDFGVIDDQLKTVDGRDNKSSEILRETVRKLRDMQ